MLPTSPSTRRHKQHRLCGLLLLLGGLGVWLGRTGNLQLADNSSRVAKVVVFYVSHSMVQNCFGSNIHMSHFANVCQCTRIHSFQWAVSANHSNWDDGFELTRAHLALWPGATMPSKQRYGWPAELPKGDAFLSGAPRSRILRRVIQ